jgi:hypothetical protein
VQKPRTFPAERSSAAVLTVSSRGRSSRKRGSPVRRRPGTPPRVAARPRGSFLRVPGACRMPSPAVRTLPPRPCQSSFTSPTRWVNDTDRISTSWQPAPAAARGTRLLRRSGRVGTRRRLSPGALRRTPRGRRPRCRGGACARAGPRIKAAVRWCRQRLSSPPTCTRRLLRTEAVAQTLRGGEISNALPSCPEVAGRP